MNYAVRLQVVHYFWSMVSFSLLKFIIKDILMQKYLLAVLGMLVVCALVSQYYIQPFVREIYIFIIELNSTQTFVLMGIVGMCMTVGLFPSTFVSFVAGILYGWDALLGVVCIYLFAQNMGYFMAKLMPLQTKWVDHAGMHNFRKKLQKNIGLTVFWTRLSPAIPFSITNFLFSWAKTNWLYFNIFGILGMIPRTVLMVWLGTKTGQVARQSTDGSEWLIFVILLLLSVLGFYLSVLRDKKMEKSEIGSEIISDIISPESL